MVRLTAFALSIVSCLAISTYTHEIKQDQLIDLRLRQIKKFETDHKTHFQQGPLYKCQIGDETCDPYNRYYILPEKEKIDYDL